MNSALKFKYSQGLFFLFFLRNLSMKCVNTVITSIKKYLRIKVALGSGKRGKKTLFADAAWAAFDKFHYRKQCLACQHAVLNHISLTVAFF